MEFSTWPALDVMALLEPETRERYKRHLQGLPLDGSPKAEKPQTNKERVVELAKQGKTAAEIGEALGITKDNARVTAFKQGVKLAKEKRNQPKPPDVTIVILMTLWRLQRDAKRPITRQEIVEATGLAPSIVGARLGFLRRKNRVVMVGDDWEVA